MDAGSIFDCRTRFIYDVGMSDSELIFVFKPTEERLVSVWLDFVRSARERGAKVVVDYTDHHLLGTNFLAMFYREIFDLATVVVVNSAQMSANLRDHFSGRITVIDDPLEYEIREPAVGTRSDHETVALWFGHASNIVYLMNYLASTHKINHAVRLLVVTNLYPFPAEYIEFLKKCGLRNLTMEILPWSGEMLLRGAERADVCILPAGVMDLKKSGASSNRLITAVGLGLPTAASMLPSYLPFKDYFFDLASSGLEKFFSSPQLWRDRVLSCQEILRERHTMASAQLEWKTLLQSLLTHKA